MRTFARPILIDMPPWIAKLLNTPWLPLPIRYTHLRTWCCRKIESPACEQLPREHTVDSAKQRLYHCRYPLNAPVCIMWTAVQITHWLHDDGYIRLVVHGFSADEYDLLWKMSWLWISCVNFRILWILLLVGSVAAYGDVNFNTFQCWFPLYRIVLSEWIKRDRGLSPAPTRCKKL